MNTFLTLSAWQFAAAGAVCALGPVIIHLLNRRRYRVVHWAAMDFLREAIQRNRRILQIRDLLLLVLRTAAILLFGLALARPFFARNSTAFDHSQPLHAVLLIDNSLSMGYQSLEGDLLARAKERAKGFIEKLPPGSRYSILPLCGAGDHFSPDPYDTAEAAREAVEQIEVVDRSAGIVRAANQAREACLAAPDLAKRIVLFSDQQATNWQDLNIHDLFAGMPPVQVVDIPPGETENTWIASIQVQDALADVDTPTTILVEIGHRGASTRRDVPVTLSVGDTVIGEKTVTLEPGFGTRQVDFQHVFNNLPEMPEANRPVFATVRASLPPDRLPQDDERFVAVPVVVALPVVFIDQYGGDEDPARNKIGETRHLRKLLAPKSARTDTGKPLVQIHHIRVEELTRELLSDARLVVIAGVRDPGAATDLLHDYVRQGGRLIIAAGADFDPDAWNLAAWREGNGILPLPLAKDPIGDLPETAGTRLKPFSLSYESLVGQKLFQLDNVAENDLRDLYAEPFFFKAVKADESKDVIEKLRQALHNQLNDELEFLTAAEIRQQEFTRKEAKGELSESERSDWKADERRKAELRPQWLSWAQSPEFRGLEDDRLPPDPQDRRRNLDQRTERRMPRVVARFAEESGSAFVVERQVERGRVTFISTGLLSSWNTLPVTNTMVLFDRLLRGLMEGTLPERNLQAIERVILALPTDDRDLTVSLRRPGKETTPESLDVGFIGQDQRGVTVPHLDHRGVYRVRGEREETLTAAGGDGKEMRTLWEIPLVVNGDAAESELEPITPARFEEMTQGTDIRWVAAGDEISLAGDARLGQNSWWWFVLLVLVLLLVEMAMLAWPAFRDGPATASAP